MLALTETRVRTFVEIITIIYFQCMYGKYVVYVRMYYIQVHILVLSLKQAYPEKLQWLVE